MVSKVNENDIWKIIKFEINFIIMEKNRCDLKGKINFFILFLTWVWKDMSYPSCLRMTMADPSPLGLATLPGPRQLGKASNPRLMVPRHDPMILELASSPNSNGFGLWLDPSLLGLSF